MSLDPVKGKEGYPFHDVPYFFTIFSLMVPRRGVRVEGQTKVLSLRQMAGSLEEGGWDSYWRGERRVWTGSYLEDGTSQRFVSVPGVRDTLDQERFGCWSGGGWERNEWGLRDTERKVRIFLRFE